MPPSSKDTYLARTIRVVHLGAGQLGGHCTERTVTLFNNGYVTSRATFNPLLLVDMNYFPEMLNLEICFLWLNLHLWFKESHGHSVLLSTDTEWSVRISFEILFSIQDPQRHTKPESQWLVHVPDLQMTKSMAGRYTFVSWFSFLIFKALLSVFVFCVVTNFFNFLVTGQFPISKSRTKCVIPFWARKYCWAYGEGWVRESPKTGIPKRLAGSWRHARHCTAVDSIKPSILTMGWVWKQFFLRCDTICFHQNGICFVTSCAATIVKSSNSKKKQTHQNRFSAPFDGPGCVVSMIRWLTRHLLFVNKSPAWTRCSFDMTHPCSILLFRTRNDWLH